MAAPKYSWLSTPNVRRSWIAVVCLVWTAVSLYLYRSDYASYLDAKFARPIDFHARDLLGQGIDVHPQLKMYSIDDSAYAKLGKFTLNIDEWSRLLENFAASKPRAIVVDAMFSSFEDPYGRVDEAIARLAALEVPVYVGTYLTSRPVSYRHELSPESDSFDLRRLTGRQLINEAELPRMVERRSWYVYGPAPELRTVFSHVGNFSYTGNAKVAALSRVSEAHAIPHLGLTVAENLQIKDGLLFNAGEPIPVDRDGEMMINFMHASKFYKNNWSMTGVLSRTLKGKPLTSVKEGDVVLIIPQLFTGSTDFKETPYGRVPGGFVIASVINSALTGEWLKPLMGTELIIIAAALFAAFLAVQLSAGMFWIAKLLSIVAGFGIATYFFAFHNIVIPWLYPMLTFVGAGMSLFAVKTYVSERKAQTLRQAFEGAVSDEELRKIIKRPDRLNFEARERVVTIVFIDVVGFSLLAENMLPRTAFESLKHMLGTISETIHQYGGIVDKTLGDGLLCYFGYRLDDDTATTDHAEQALRCAVKIQEQNIKRNIEAASSGDHVYPLRIGINTASCYIGDLASGDSIDFTVVGNGVNFAKRLEGACDMHSVLMGGTTHDLVKAIGLPPAAMTKRFIRIKHHSELVEAFEYDPFYQEPELRKVALEAFRKCANIERVAQRWPVRDPSKIQLTSDFGAGELVNFSHKGLSVKFNQLLVKGTTVNLSLDAAGGILKSLLAKEGVRALHGEVRWGYDDGSGFVHGIMIQNLADLQSERLVEYLCEFAFSRDASEANRDTKVS